MVVPDWLEVACQEGDVLVWAAKRKKARDESRAWKPLEEEDSRGGGDVD
jgi:hypothetical protein